jgi:hypothetical protein
MPWSLIAKGEWYEFMTRDLVRSLASNKRLRWLEIIQADREGEDASLFAINERGETSGFERKTFR